MSRMFTRLGCVALMLFSAALTLHAQTHRVSGTVTDKDTKEPVVGASVVIVGQSGGTSTNSAGEFTFTTSAKLPFPLVASSVGFGREEKQITGSTTGIFFELGTAITLGGDVVISASRTPERILESPVTIERINAEALKEIPAPSFYDGLANLKGVEVSTQSLTFKSINTRGFNSNGNTRFNQYVDGMDNQAPGLNFSVGNIVGMTELDVDNVELLPGASSALYGAGGISGTLLMTSKDPFRYQGASFQYKTGINHVNDGNTSTKPYNQLDVRLAKSWNNKFGVKTSFSFLQARDWSASNTSNFDRIGRTAKPGDRNSDPNYDGINVYGDEISQNMINVSQSVEAKTRAGILAATGGALNIQNTLNLLPANTPYASYVGFVNANIPAALRPTVLNGYLPFYYGLKNNLIPNQFVSRTGYAERDLVDYDTKSLKTSSAVYYKFTPTIQAIAQVNYGTGTSVYTGTDRYSLRDFSIGQYKLELRGDDFFLRAYTTQERSGKAYNATILGTFINEAWKPSTTWFPQYIGTYLATGSYATARAAADQGRFLPGSPSFETAKDNITSKSIGPQNGAKFNDKTNLYHYEGLYNFTSLLNNVVDVQVGASYRDYFLHSDGTIFDDATRSIVISEYGAFAQVGRKFSDLFKLTVSGRYDKSKNFEGRFTPRVTGVFTVAKNNNIRVSYQTAFRNPTTQDQYIDLAVGGGSTRLIGGLPELLNKYNLYDNKGVTAQSYRAFLATVAAGTPNPGVLEEYSFSAQALKPESVQALELGYKGLIVKNLLIDTYGYYNIYKDFIGGVDLYQNPTTNAVKFSVATNTPGNVKSYGGAFGLEYLIRKLNLSGNVSYNKLSQLPENIINTFNTPEIRYNLGIGSKEIFKNVGFNVQYRWQDKFYWNSTFVSGEVPAFSTADAQLNLKVPSINSVFKIGGSNILNKYYITSYGNPDAGAVYYVSVSFNP
ncbi:outer membrane receptor protein involved in Fe transport [Pedobacter sp. UYP30]|uniref:TonB-dependent receptor n=1 Tax=Pedobacter sp. UYP30 TaxID=1756400 RepID=UPI003391BB72